MSGISMAKFLADNTLFVAGIKAFPERKTNSLRLLLHLIDQEDVNLVLDDVLSEEYKKYAERFGGERTRTVIKALLSEAKITDPCDRFVRAVKPYFDEESSPEDIIHAAAALQEGAIIITNDSDFGAAAEGGIIEVWSHSRAMKEFEII